MTYRIRESSDRRCAFCGRARSEVRKLVAGPNVFICERCLSVCRQLLVDESRETDSMDPIESKPCKPKELKERLDEWVIGQERAKKMLTVAVYNHMKRLRLRGNSEIELQKSNILLMGPPGTGKTHLARTLARILQVPFTLADATPLTQAGYVGEDVESIIAKLLRAAGGDVERAEHGIIYLDEVDKLAKRPGHERDVSGEGVQQGMLKLLEGKKVVVRVNADKNGMAGDPVEVDTSNILFIGGGAFDGLARAVSQRAHDVSGFRSGGRQAVDLDEGLREVSNQDLQRYGFLPEFLGRFPVHVSLHALDEAALVRILTEPKDALLRQYQRLFQMEGARLECTPDGLGALARASMVRKTGARGLRAVLEEVLLDTMFDLPSKRGHFILDARAVETHRLERLHERTAA